MSNPPQLPPDAEQEELADEVNKRLGGEKRINFFRVRTEDGVMRYGVVFSYGMRDRTFRVQDAQWFDPDELVAEVEAWAGRL